MPRHSLLPVQPAPSIWIRPPFFPGFRFAVVSAATLAGRLGPQAVISDPIPAFTLLLFLPRHTPSFSFTTGAFRALSSSSPTPACAATLPSPPGHPRPANCLSLSPVAAPGVAARSPLARHRRLTPFGRSRRCPALRSGSLWPLISSLHPRTGTSTSRFDLAPAVSPLLPRLLFCRASSSLHFPAATSARLPLLSRTDPTLRPCLLLRRLPYAFAPRSAFPSGHSSAALASLPSLDLFPFHVLHCTPSGTPPASFPPLDLVPS